MGIPRIGGLPSRNAVAAVRAIDAYWRRPAGARPSDIFSLTQPLIDVLFMFMFTVVALATQDDTADPDQDRRADGAPAGFAGVLLVVRALIGFGRQMLATVRQGSNDRAAVAGIKLRFKTLDIAEIIARISRALTLAADLETRLEKLAARVPAECESDEPSERQPRVRAATAANDGLPSAAAIAKRLRQRPIGAVLAEICRELGISARDPLWNQAFMPILNHGGRPPFPSDEEDERRWAAIPMLWADPDVREALECQAAAFLPPSGAGPPWLEH